MTWTYVWFPPVSSSISKCPTAAQVPASPLKEPLVHSITAITITPRTYHPVNQMPLSAWRTARQPQRMELWIRMRTSRAVSRLTPLTISMAVRLCPRTLFQPPSGTVHPCPHILTPPCLFLSLTLMLMERKQKPLACEGRKHQGFLRAPKDQAQGKPGQVESQRQPRIMLHLHVRLPPAPAQHQQNPLPIQAQSLPPLENSVCSWTWPIFPLEPPLPQSVWTSSDVFDPLVTSSAATVRRGRSL